MSGPKGAELQFILGMVNRNCGKVSEIMKQINLFRDEIKLKKLEDNDCTSGLLKNIGLLFQKADDLFDASKKINAVDIRKRRAESDKNFADMKSLGYDIFQVKRNVTQKIIELRDSIFRKIKMLENAKTEIILSYSASDFQAVDETIDAVKNKLKEIGDSVIIPDLMDISYDNFNYNEIVIIQSKIEAAENALRNACKESRGYVKSIRIKEPPIKLNEPQKNLIDMKISKYETIDEFINAKKNNMKASEEETVILEKTNALLAKITELAGSENYSLLLAKYDKIKDEEYSQRRILLYNDLLISCESTLKEFKKKSKNIDELESADSDKKQMGEIIKRAFNEIGYETDEDFETILVSNKKIFIAKESMKNYQVQVITNAANSMLQVEVVRVVENKAQLEENTRAQEIRDIEVETEFCADYEKVLRKIEEQGIVINHKMRKNPGEVKVRKIISTEACRRSFRNQVQPNAGLIIKKI